MGLRRRRAVVPTGTDDRPLCPLCGRCTTVGEDGRCLLGHRVRAALPASLGTPLGAAHASPPASATAPAAVDAAEYGSSRELADEAAFETLSWTEDLRSLGEAFGGPAEPPAFAEAMVGCPAEATIDAGTSADDAWSDLTGAGWAGDSAAAGTVRSALDDLLDAGAPAEPDRLLRQPAAQPDTPDRAEDPDAGDTAALGTGAEDTDAGDTDAGDTDAGDTDAAPRHRALGLASIALGSLLAVFGAVTLAG